MMNSKATFSPLLPKQHHKEKKHPFKNFCLRFAFIVVYDPYLRSFLIDMKSATS
jgi:hypothetical protein